MYEERVKALETDEVRAVAEKGSRNEPITDAEQELWNNARTVHDDLDTNTTEKPSVESLNQEIAECKERIDHIKEAIANRDEECSEDNMEEGYLEDSDTDSDSDSAGSYSVGSFAGGDSGGPGGPGGDSGGGNSGNHGGDSGGGNSGNPVGENLENSFKFKIT
jgi:hypothetical protein